MKSGLNSRLLGSKTSGVPNAETTHAAAPPSTTAIIRSTLEVLAVASSKRVMGRAVMGDAIIRGGVAGRRRCNPSGRRAAQASGG